MSRLCGSFPFLGTLEGIDTVQFAQRGSIKISHCARERDSGKSPEYPQKTLTPYRGFQRGSPPFGRRGLFLTQKTGTPFDAVGLELLHPRCSVQ